MAVNKDDAVNAQDAQTGQTPDASKQPGGFKRFLREVWTELKKTNWPTRDQLTKSTIVVITTVVVVAAYLFLADQVSSLVIQGVGLGN